jgi:hypothetical protein
MSKKIEAGNYNGEQPGHVDKRDHSGAHDSENGFPFRIPAPPVLDDPKGKATAGVEVVTHGDYEEIRGHVDKATRATEPSPEYVVPVRVVQDVRDTYATAGQVAIPPLTVVRAVGAIPGRFSLTLANASTNASTVYLGFTNLTNAVNGYPLVQNGTTPELKHDKEVWVYNSDQTNTAYVAVLAQYNQTNPVYPVAAKNGADRTEHHHGIFH